MSDIVERLRKGETCWEAGDCCVDMSASSGCLCAEAADTITRLTADNERLKVEAQISYAEGFHDGDENGSKIKREFVEKLEAEVERLRAALSEIAVQKKTTELVTATDVEYADFEDGYDMCIGLARAALSPPALSGDKHE